MNFLNYFVKFIILIAMCVLLISCGSETTSKSNNEYKKVRENAWEYVSEMGWEEPAEKDWESAEIKKQIVNDDYVLNDNKYLNKEVLAVKFKEKKNSVTGVPIILVDPETSEVIGYMSTE